MNSVEQRFVALTNDVTSETSLARLLDRIVGALTDVSGAERAYVVLIENGEPTVRPTDISWTILGRVLAENRPLILADAMKDRVFSTVRSVQGIPLRSVCVIPLRASGETIGALYLAHSGTAGAFTPTLMETLLAYAGLATLAILNLRRPRSCPSTASSATEKIVAVDPRMRHLLKLVKRFGPLPYPVYVHGESGTGKELLARALHDASGRTGPFVPANGAAIAAGIAESELFGHVRGAFTGASRNRPGLFEQADRGTLFLDEVEAMPLALQEKLLRVAQDGVVRRVGAEISKRVDVRLVSASNEDLAQLVRCFRRDLYYRLNVLRLDVPPLRERPSDLPSLVEHFLERIGRELGGEDWTITSRALERLAHHSWPGNVRELENVLRRACALSRSSTLDIHDFEFVGREDPHPVPEGIVPVEEYIRQSVKRYGDQMDFSELARHLGVSRKTLWRLRRKWGMV